MSNTYSFLLVLQVNGQSLLGATHEEGVKGLRAVGEKLVLMVCDGYDPAVELSSPTSAGSSLSQASQISQISRHESISSIDRDDEDTLIVQKVSTLQRDFSLSKRNNCKRFSF